MVLKFFAPNHQLAGLAFRRLSELCQALHDESSAAEYNSKAIRGAVPNFRVRSLTVPSAEAAIDRQSIRRRCEAHRLAGVPDTQPSLGNS